MFDSESHWRQEDLATLPAITSHQALQLVDAMDEMLFALCDPGDSLLTAKRMDRCHTEYLRSIGFDFVNNNFDVRGGTCESVGGVGAANMFVELACQPIRQDAAEFFRSGAVLEPWAAIPGIADMAVRHGLVVELPPQEVVRRVNSKVYSTEMRERLSIPNKAVTVFDVPSLMRLGANALGDGPILLKDDYGVSGKGSFLVKDAPTLSRIGKYLAKQVKVGKTMRLILEPYLPKTLDFSCRFCIRRDGAIEDLTLQRLENDRLSFRSVSVLEKAFCEQIANMGYLDIVKQVGEHLFADGYFRHVCVDSMLLEGGDWMPIVEINARRSMSVLRNAMERRLAGSETAVCLTYEPTTSDGSTRCLHLLDGLRRANLLYESGSEIGVVPMTVGTLFPAGLPARQSPFAGRLYTAIVYDTSERREFLLAKLSDVLEYLGLRGVASKTQVTHSGRADA